MPSPLRLGPGREFQLIRRFLRGHTLPPGVRVGPGDDCAVVTGSGIALSTDLSVEGVHFRRDWLRPREIGWRACMAALSDLAAVAATPIGVLASLAVSRADAGAFATALMRGVREAAEAAGGALLGGDLTRSPGPALLDVTVVGDAAAPVLRSGARPDDGVWVTGELGGAAAFVEAALAGRRPRRGARQRFAAPQARLAEARWLAERGLVSAMLDLSDGLVGDAGHLAAASGVAIDLEPERVPVHPAARRSPALALRGGEDYELCLASAQLTEDLAVEFHALFGVRLTRVGRVRAGRRVWLHSDGRRVPAGAAGYQHFGED